ncbi:hypothetical protein ACU4GD_21635 [Cupriavidus basilensis]
MLEWLKWLPESELDKHPRLRLAVAWALALSERHQQAEAQVRKILHHATPDDAMRYEIDLILSAAAYYADEPGLHGRPVRSLGGGTARERCVGWCRRMPIAWLPAR